MNKFLTYLIVFIVAAGCGDTQMVEKTNLEWITITLPNGWNLQAPSNFKVTLGQGIDSNPGTIYSDSDGIELKFDSGREMILQEDCDFSTQVKKAQKEITFGFYKDFYKIPILHKAHIDTIDNKVAIIVQPKQIENGTVGISISECNRGVWLGINGENLTDKNHKLVLKIFKTLKLN